MTKNPTKPTNLRNFEASTLPYREGTPPRPILLGLREGDVGFIAAPGGTGKSFFALSFALSHTIYATRHVFPSIHEITHGGQAQTESRSPVLYVALEDRDYDIGYRIETAWEAIRAESLRDVRDEHIGGWRAMLDKDFFVWRADAGRPLNITDLEPSTSIGYDNNGVEIEVAKPHHTTDDIVMAAQSVGAKLIVIDTLIMSHSGDENDSADAKKITSALRYMAVKTGAAVLCIHHTPKSSDDIFSPTYARGSGQLVSGITWQLNMFADHPTNLVGAYVSRNNAGARPNEVIVFERQQNGELYELGTVSREQWADLMIPPKNPKDALDPDERRRQMLRLLNADTPPPPTAPTIGSGGAAMLRLLS